MSVFFVLMFTFFAGHELFTEGATTAFWALTILMHLWIAISRLERR